MSKLSDAAERNKQPILEVLGRVLPPRGSVLEVASGSGQHVAHFAAALPNLTWQPSDREVEDFADPGLPNVLPIIALDTTGPWPITHADAVVCINMLHASSWEAGRALIAGTGCVAAATRAGAAHARGCRGRGARERLQARRGGRDALQQPFAGVPLRSSGRRRAGT